MRKGIIVGFIAALLVAGVATASGATHYIITSLGQVKPSVVKQLKGKQGPRGKQGARGKTGSAGPQGPQGAQGPKGPTGAQGVTGASGVDNPLVWTYTGATGPDTSRCGPAWANDTYDATFIVNAEPDGSYDITKIIKGTFVTIAGASQPNPASCPGTTQTGGVTGTFYGTETWSVPSPSSGEAADFDPYAVCGTACTPHTTGTTSSNEAQDAAFESAFFDGATESGFPNYDFVYTTASNGTWTDSNTPSNGGNITG